MSRPTYGFKPATLAFLNQVREAREKEDREKGRAPRPEGEDVDSQLDIIGPERRNAASAPANQERMHPSNGDAVVLSRQNMSLQARTVGTKTRTDPADRARDEEPTDADRLLPSSPSARATRNERKPTSSSVALESRGDATDEEVIDLIDDDDGAETNSQEPLPSSSPRRPRHLPLMSFEDDEGVNNEDEITPVQQDPSNPATPSSTPLDDDDDLVAPLSTKREAGSKNDVSSLPPAKRKAEAKDEDNKKGKRAKITEKRGAPYRPHPSKDILARMSRTDMRLFLVDKKETEERLDYRVMGTNGNIYKCVIACTPTCSCMDFQKRVKTSKEAPCKHLIFLYLRVLKLEKEDPKWWQKRLLPSEVKEICNNIPRVESNVFADSRVIEQYQLSQGEDQEQDECPVCFEEFTETEETVPCKKCSKYFHKQCMRNWINARQSSSDTPYMAPRKVSCPTCRADISREDVELEGGQYQNLARYSTQHERPLSLAERYVDSHQYIGRGRGRVRGRGGNFAVGRGGKRRGSSNS